MLATSHPCRLNPHYRLLIILFFFLFFSKLVILTTAVAFNYIAIICFLVPDWCSIALKQSQAVFITFPLVWQAHLRYSGFLKQDKLNVCLNFCVRSNNLLFFFNLSLRWCILSPVWPSWWFTVIISLQSEGEEIIDMYFSPSIFVPSSQVDSLKLGHV